eukprot:318395-Pelagomonas_calceolata.AAC.14
MVQLLLNSPEVKVDSRDADEAPALHFAIQEGHVEVRLPQQELLRAKPIQGLDCSGLTHHNSLEIKFVPKAGVHAMLGLGSKGAHTQGGRHQQQRLVRNLRGFIDEYYAGEL